MRFTRLRTAILSALLAWPFGRVRPDRFFPANGCLCGRMDREKNQRRHSHATHCSSRVPSWWRWRLPGCQPPLRRSAQSRGAVKDGSGCRSPRRDR